MTTIQIVLPDSITEAEATRIIRAAIREAALVDGLPRWDRGLARRMARDLAAIAAAQPLTEAELRLMHGDR